MSHKPTRATQQALGSNLPEGARAREVVAHLGHAREHVSDLAAPGWLLRALDTALLRFAQVGPNAIAALADGQVRELRRDGRLSPSESFLLRCEIEVWRRDQAGGVRYVAPDAEEVDSLVREGASLRAASRLIVMAWASSVVGARRAPEQLAETALELAEHLSQVRGAPPAWHELDPVEYAVVLHRNAQQRGSGRAPVRARLLATAWLLRHAGAREPRPEHERLCRELEALAACADQLSAA